MIRLLHRLFLGSLRRQLIFGVAAVHAIMMTFFVWDLTQRQQALILDRQAEQASALANSLATSSAGWLASRDLSGLQELVEAQQRYPELLFAMLLDEQGQVLAHTDRARLGQYLGDLPDEVRTTELYRGTALVDVVVPAMLDKRHVGWARVGIGQGRAVRELAKMTRNGVLYALMAIAVGSLLAWQMGRRITRRLYAIQTAMDKVRSGNLQARSALTGTDEAARMAHDFNLMLDLLAYRTTLLSGLLDSIPDIIFFKDTHGIYLGCNPEFCRIVGRPQDEIIGHSDYDFFPKESADFFREQDRLMLEQGLPRRNEEWVDYPDGRRLLLETIKAPFRDTGGAEIGLLGVARDITVRKQLEDALRAREQELKDAQHMSRLGSWRLDLRSNHLTWSDEIYNLFELDPQAFAATYEAFLSAIHPEDRALVDQAYSDSVAQHTGYDIEHRLLMPDGRIKIVHERCETTYDEAGNPIQSVGTVQDITERKQSERSILLMNVALSNVCEEGYLIDEQARFHYVNEESCRALGYSRDELLKMSVFDVDPDFSPQRWADHWRDLKAGGTITFEGHHRARDGRIFPVEISANYFEYDGRGYNMALVRDITERKRAEQDIRRLNEELEQRVQERTAELQRKSREMEAANCQLQGLDRLKSMFIASMSHELRTPLNSIIGFSSIMLDEWLGSLNPEQKAKLAIVLRAGKHLLSLVNDVIDVSKIEAGSIEVLAEEFDLQNLLDEVLSLVKNDIEAKKIVLEVSTLPLRLRTDRRRLLQCLMNLLSNAVKFTEAGTITVKTTVSPGGADTQVQDRLTITVSDTGIGIREEDMAILFTAFGRIQSPLSLKVKGTGLGLYLVKKITADILQGEVRAESRPGAGSSFSLCIPVRL